MKLLLIGVLLLGAASDTDAARPNASPFLKAVLDGPRAGCEDIVFAQRVSGRGHWYGNFGHYCETVSPYAITWWNLGDGTAVKGENNALGGLMDEKFDPKESYRMLDRLINQEWKTRLSAKTDSQCLFRFRGFYGKYSIKVTTDGKTQEFPIELARDGQRTHQLTLKQ